MKKSRFGKVFAIVTSALLLCIFAFFAFFYDYMKNYEISQPSSAAEEFASSVSREALADLITDTVQKNELPHESEENVNSALTKLIFEADLICRKDFENSTSASPVYILYAGELPVYRLTLEEGDGVRYGFTSWNITHSEAILSALDAADYVNVYIPEGSALYVNGVEFLADSKGTSPYRYMSKWEANSPLSVIRYLVPTVSDASFECRLGELTCEMTSADGDISFLYPSDLFKEYVIEAPATAEVSVNGIPLTAEDVYEANIPYELSPVEKDRADAPTMTLYRIVGLTKSPAVTATMGEESLTYYREDNTFYVNYPAHLLYSCEITVPAGSTVTLNGYTLTEELITYSEYESAELFSYTSAPAYDVYEITGLFFEPEHVEITYRGIALDAPADVDGNTYSYSVLYPSTDDPRAGEVALDFLKIYLHYTSQGYRNTHENMLSVLEFIPEGIPLYTKIIKSENGFSWTSPVASMKYNILEIKSMRAYPGELTLVTVGFDVSQTFYGAAGREYRGDFLILLNSELRVVGLEIHAEK